MLKGKKDKEPGGELVFGKSSAAADDPSAAGNSLRLTIHDVAKLAGVSVGTVSRVLNGFDNVLPETKTRVQGDQRMAATLPPTSIDKNK